MELNTAIKPCPFCGSKKVEYEFSGSQGYITCRNCYCIGPEHADAADPVCSISAAIEIWNDRK